MFLQGWLLGLSLESSLDYPSFCFLSCFRFFIIILVSLKLVEVSISCVSSLHFGFIIFISLIVNCLCFCEFSPPKIYIIWYQSLGYILGQASILIPNTKLIKKNKKTQKPHKKLQSCQIRKVARPYRATTHDRATFSRLTSTISHPQILTMFLPLA